MSLKIIDGTPGSISKWIRENGTKLNSIEEAIYENGRKEGAVQELEKFYDFVHMKYNYALGHGYESELIREIKEEMERRLKELEKWLIV